MALTPYVSNGSTDLTMAVLGCGKSSPMSADMEMDSHVSGTGTVRRIGVDVVVLYRSHTIPTPISIPVPIFFFLWKGQVTHHWAVWHRYHGRCHSQRHPDVALRDAGP